MPSLLFPRTRKRVLASDSAQQCHDRESRLTRVGLVRRPARSLEADDQLSRPVDTHRQTLEMSGIVSILAGIGMGTFPLLLRSHALAEDSIATHFPFHHLSRRSAPHLLGTGLLDRQAQGLVRILVRCVRRPADRQHHPLRLLARSVPWSLRPSLAALQGLASLDEVPGQPADWLLPSPLQSQASASRWVRPSRLSLLGLESC